MPVSKPVKIGEREFESKRAAIEYIRALVNSQPVHMDIGSDTAAFQVFAAILAMHPEAAEKIGDGVASFAVMFDDAGNRMLTVNRTDGTSTDFSWNKCINGRPMPLKSQFAAAARMAVRPDIVSYRSKYVEKYGDASDNVPCEQTGRWCHISECHVDHHPTTFQQIVNRFLAEEAVELSPELFSPIADNRLGIRFVDLNVAGRFRVYHAKHAKLMVVWKHINLTRKRQKGGK